MDTITEIPIEQLHESATNPRRTFSGLDELAASIRSEGRIHEPLLVRPRLANILRPDEHDGYEVVFGHRRLRAAELAGLATVPCMVRAMDHIEAASARAAENLQREDLHPIEEAEGFQALLQAGGMTADQLADKLGKSRSHVYARLKLLQACPEVREACAQGRIGSEVALLIARLRTPKLQAKALQYIKARNQDAEDGGKESVRRIRGILAEHFNTALKGALFDREDATLLPDAGPCSACPKRAGNAPEFADIAESRDHSHWQRDRYGPDVCTDPDCYAAKKAAHLKRQAAELQARGQTVVDGNAARAALGADGQVKGAYVALKDVKAQLGKPLKYITNAKGAAVKMPLPPVVTIQDPRTGKTVQAVKRADAELAGARLAPATSKRDRHAEQEARRKAEQAANEAKARIERQVRLAVLRNVREAMLTRERDAFDLGLAARAAWAGVHWRARAVMAELWSFRNADELDHRLDEMDVQQLTRLIMDCALAGDCVVDAYSVDRKPETLLLAARHYGIDVDQVRRTVVGEAGASPTGFSLAA